jgi:alpha-tubulin suppressor-like RCC1 family protein
LSFAISPLSARGFSNSPGIALVALDVPAHRVAKVREISAGSGYVCALLTNQKLECWGGNWDGQLGNGAKASSASPVGMAGLG